MKKALLLIGLAGLTACTKEVPYKYKFTDGAMSVSSISTTGDYIFTASAQQMSRNTVEGRPYSYSDSRRVSLRFTNNSLQVLQKEVDARYNAPINDKLIVEFPIERVQFGCATDAYGECTSSEEEQTNLPEESRSQFRFKRDGTVNAGTLEILPIILDEKLGSDCYSTVSSKISGFEVSDNAINIQVEKRFMQNINCMENMENGLSDTSITAVYQYSMVRADSVLSRDFQTRNYDFSDEDTFGFFMTERDVRDVDNSQAETNKVRIMNHWNPNRTNIDYYLSREFDKPRNAYLKDLTKEAFRRLNIGLADSGAKFRITLHDHEGKNPGDIRNSMLVLVEDPTESGLLGYGPQTEDPVTGEIISARTIMFLAGFEQQTHMYYNEIGRFLEEHEAEQRAQSQNQTDGNITVGEAPAQTGGQDRHLRQLQVATALGEKTARSKSFTHRIAGLLAPNTAANVSGNVSRPLNAVAVARDIRKSRERNGEYTLGNVQSYVKYLKEAKNCELHTGEGVDDIMSMRPELANRIKTQYTYADGPNMGKLIPWFSLTAAQRQDIVKMVVGEIWIPVVLHELGHNMGLRHNFKGSEDNANQYKSDELARLSSHYGLTGHNEQSPITYRIPYSTIMEYGDDLHALPILGKYDVAALRYGYAKKVELSNSTEDHPEFTSLEEINQNSGQASILSIKTLKERLAAQHKEIKDFGFCTDEHVGPNPGCRRFDEGSSYVEIVDNLIASYKNNYWRRNFRNNVINYSVWNDASILSGRTQRLLDMRQFMEVYERIKHVYGIGDNHAVFAEGGPLAELKTAALKAARFYMEILRTPDYTCVLAEANDPSKAIAVVPLASTGPSRDDLNCANAEFRQGIIVIGEAGKHFNNKKDPNSTNNYVDQIDVRGYYLDKMAAARALFLRNLGSAFTSHNQFLDNAWDIADLRPELQELVVGLITNKLTSKQIVTLNDGSQVELEAPYDYHESHLVKQPIHQYLAGRLGIRNTSVYFSEILGGTIAGSAVTNADNSASGTALRSLVSLRLVSNMDQTSVAPGVVQQDIGGDRTVYAGRSNLVARDMIFDIQVREGLSAALNDYRTQVAATATVPAHPVRRTYMLLFNFLAGKIQAAQQAHISIENLKPDFDAAAAKAAVEGLTQAEAEFVVQIGNDAGILDVALKMQQLAGGELMAKEDIIKVLEYLPRN